MAKKVRRVRRPRNKKPVSTEVEADVKQPKLSAAEQFELEYAYVLRDLRRVFVLAGFMFALLIVLNLILQVG